MSGGDEVGWPIGSCGRRRAPQVTYNKAVSSVTLTVRKKMLMVELVVNLATWQARWALGLSVECSGLKTIFSNVVYGC